jgi:hypothetical protein
MDSTRSELDQLLSFMLPFAEQMLNKNEGFHPFAAVLTDGGTIEPITDVPSDDRPDPTELLAHLADAARRRAAEGNVRACAFCADVKVVPPGRDAEVDAVRVVLEHVADNDAVAVFRPYTRRRGPLKLKFHELFAVRSPREVLAQA